MANRMEDEAVEFLSLFYEEHRLDGKEARIRDVCEAIRTDGTYEHTAEELAFGARLAWRNSNRCIGRLFWERLTVIDERKAHTEEAVAQALLGISNMQQTVEKSFQPLRCSNKGPRSVFGMRNLSVTQAIAVMAALLAILLPLN